MACGYLIKVLDNLSIGVCYHTPPILSTLKLIATIMACGYLQPLLDDYQKFGKAKQNLLIRAHKAGNFSQKDPCIVPLVDTTSCNLDMSAKYIVGSLVASGVVAYALDILVSDKKMFGGTTPTTVRDKEWWEETDKKFQAWPRTAGPPVVMNPITRQNFIVKTKVDE